MSENDGWKKHESVRLPVWKPDAQGNPGEVVMVDGKQVVAGVMIEGLVTLFKFVLVDNKDKLLLNLKTDKGDVAVWCNSILQRKMDEAKVGVDSIIRIVYLGMKKSQKSAGKSYKDYDLYTR